MALTENYFDIWSIFQNEVFGSFMLFALVGLVVILIITLKTRMPFQLSIMFTVLWFLVLSIASELLYITAILGIGTFFYIMLSRFFRRG